MSARSFDIIIDPRYQQRFMLYLCRALPVESWLPKSLVLSACARGLLGDLQRALTGKRRAPSRASG